MNYINFSKASCKNCYKCLRACLVKAIKFEEGQAEIVQERCIACGQCMEICPQNATKVVSNLDRVKEAIVAKRKVIVSVTPSFAGFFNVEEGKIVAALRRVGFSFVEENDLGTDVLAHYYEKYLNENKLENYITTFCPSANSLIQKYYPELIKYMIPVVSPMIAQAMLLKRVYGEDCFIVFIDPCIAKKIEANEFKNEKIIDAVLNFNEVNRWIYEEGIKFDELKSEKFDRNIHRKGKSFLLEGEVINSIQNTILENQLHSIISSGTEECIEILDSIQMGAIKGVVAELNICRGGCIGGHNMMKNKKQYYSRLQKTKEYIKRKECREKDNTFNNAEIIIENINFRREFEDKSFKRLVAGEKDIEKIMKRMGKFTKEDKLNCGVCGYDTCREKAQAIFEGMAETDMCLHFMRSKAESLSNVIIENTANSIIMVDGEMNVVEINPAAQQSFMVKYENISGKPLSLLIDDSDFRKVKETGENIVGKKVFYNQYNAVFMTNINYLHKQDLILATMTNIMEEEKNKRALNRVKKNTINAAQEVIEKQMRVAQEIAGVLGETTAETKVILNKLRRIVEGEEDDIE
ncbi:[Fe-Fe] hydrogenase large subunit C-terminal domain-containing protein [Clostridium sp. ZS2-4]|uniref:[Fe-Fe] hydrogenase large subunit C-terminal domain-containing protein n=1 Tax=Clostridium sp. ZS2-4 TaxID=2987703 RepID=UPI00227CCEC8|nr:[Fe-Fe] hydrogenase large subunit C-terminal domain-containing protein [Clostridium sp. ZS2-4]MCY6353748.1 4Fe-4S binding protein [Clostridium sp. ZS2-4]